MISLADKVQVMSGETSERQISAVNAIRSVLVSPAKLAVTSAICMFLFLFVPTISVSGGVMGIVTGAMSYSGMMVTGWVGWLTFLLFALSAASRIRPSLGAYAKILVMAAFAMAFVAVIYAVLGGPAAMFLRQINQAQSQMGGLSALTGLPRVQMPTIAQVSLAPHIGVFLFAIALAALGLSEFRATTLRSTAARSV